MKRKKITDFLRKELRIASVPDSSMNGVQVAGIDEVAKIGLGVDASISLFEKAKKAGCQLIVVHHGVLWKGQKNVAREERIKWLRKNKMTLFAAHLPLDIHPLLGNNAGIARMLGMNSLAQFGRYHGVDAGFFGSLKMQRGRVVKRLDTALQARCVIQPYGPIETIKVGIISGGGSFGVHECRKHRIDTLITGERSHTTYHFAEEYGLNVIYAGHYASETVGIKQVAGLLEEKFNIETVFIDIRTGL